MSFWWYHFRLRSVHTYEYTYDLTWLETIITIPFIIIEE